MIIGLEDKTKAYQWSGNKNSNIIAKTFSFGKVVGDQNPIHGHTNLAHYCSRLSVPNTPSQSPLHTYLLLKEFVRVGQSTQNSEN